MVKRVMIRATEAISLMNQTDLIKKLIEERGYAVDFKSGISTYDMNDEDNVAFLWITVGAPAFIWEHQFAYLYARDTAKKPCAIYYTIEGIPSKAAIANSNLYRMEFIAVSEYAKECFEKVELKVKDVVHHGMDFDLVDEVVRKTEAGKNYFARAVRKRMGDRCLFVFVGRHDPRKALDKLSAAIDILNEKHKDEFGVVMITDNTARSLFNQDNVFFLAPFGHMDYHAVLSVMKACNYLVFPTMAEGFGLPLLEANSLGLPAVHLWIKPLSEFSSKEFNFVFDPLYERLQRTDVGQMFVMKEYMPEMLADMMEFALQVYHKSREEYNEYSEMAREHTRAWDYRKVYPRLLRHLGIDRLGR